MTDTCQTCRYWNRGFLECRRHAPTSVDLAPNVWPKRRWPDALDHDWCGDYERTDAIAKELAGHG